MGHNVTVMADAVLSPHLQGTLTRSELPELVLVAKFGMLMLPQSDPNMKSCALVPVP
jgi:hypothetical protein